MTGTQLHIFKDYIETHSCEFEQLLKDLVSIESPSWDKEAQDPILDLIEKELRNNAYYVFRSRGHRTGGFIYARPVEKKKNQAIQLLLGHCDTVWPLGTLESMPVGVENGRTKGPGIYDMKAGICQILVVLRLFHEKKINPAVLPVILINTDEEIGSHESTPVIRRLARIADRAFVLEPPLGINGSLKTARKGIGRYTLRIKGKAAHAGLDPGKGASAIVELSIQIQKLFAMNDPVKGISVNVGMIEGGISANVVAPESSAIIDVRVHTMEDAERIHQLIHGLTPVNPETEIKIEGGIGRLPMERTERNQHLWKVAEKIGRNMGISLEQAVAGGGSDGNTTSQFTATLDGLGTPGDGAHARHEYIFSEKFAERTLLLSMLLQACPLEFDH